MIAFVLVSLVVVHLALLFVRRPGASELSGGEGLDIGIVLDVGRKALWEKRRRYGIG